MTVRKDIDNGEMSLSANTEENAEKSAAFFASVNEVARFRYGTTRFVVAIATNEADASEWEPTGPECGFATALITAAAMSYNADAPIHIVAISESGNGTTVLSFATPAALVALWLVENVAGSLPFIPSAMKSIVVNSGLIGIRLAQMKEQGANEKEH